MDESTRKYLQGIGKKGGMAATEAKAAAARKNGALGGRPRISERVDHLGIPLIEDAFDRKTAHASIRAYQEPIADHLLLLFCLPRHSARSGWTRELNAWRKAIVRKNVGKSGKPNLSATDLARALWEEPLSTDEDRAVRLKQLRDDKGLNLPLKIQDLPSFRSFVAKFIHSILENEQFHP